MQFVTATISTTLVLLLLGTVVFFALSARSLSRYVRENVNFSIVISDDMKEKDILALKDRLLKEPFARQIDYISKKQALEEEIEAMGTNPQDFLGYNPFSASLEVKLNADYANSDSLAIIEKRLKREINVQEVLYQEELIDVVNKNIRWVNMVLLLFASILAFISFALINNTIRLMIYAKRFLLYTMKLVGASWRFIRRPFIIRNMWMGLLSGVIADIVLLTVVIWLVSLYPELKEIFTIATILPVMGLDLVAGLLMASACAYVSINKYLKMRVEELYYI